MKQKMNISIFHKFTERLLIFVSLSSFFLCLLFILRDICISKDSDIVNLFTISAVFVSSILIYAIFLIFFNYKSSTANFIRLLFFYTLFVIGVTLALRHFFYFSGVIVTASSVIQTVLFKKFLEAFFSHDLFEIQCQEKNNTKLQKELYDYNVYLSDAAQGYKQNRVMLFILGIILVIVTGISMASNIKLSVYTVILLFVYFIAAYSNFFLYSHYVREATFASNGFVNVFDYRLKIFFTALLIFSFCFLTGLLVSTNHSPLKLNWILKLLPKKEVTSTQPAAPLEIEIFEQRMQELQAFQNIASDEESQKSNNIFAIICGLFFVVGIAWFFLKPFITKVFSKALKNADLKHLFKKFFKNLGMIFKKLFHLKIKTNSFTSQNAKRFKADMSEFLKASRKSKEKKAELDRLTVHFMKLIDFGESKGIHFSKNLAPAEYTGMFKNEAAQTAGRLFEQALYAKECLSKQEETNFINAIKAAISGESAS